MTQTLPQVAHEHHQRLLLQVDRMPGIADLFLTAKAEEVRRSAGELSAFLTGTLLPHMEAAERTLYPELERMFQNRHSMAPMRREHDEIRRLSNDFAGLAKQLDDNHITIGRTLAMRRVAFQLYALLKIHLAEEEAYLRIVERGVDTDIADILAVALDHPGIHAA
jgi:hypothetical protein